MKKFLYFLTLSFIFSASVAALAQTDVEPPKACQQCGMDRTMFGYSRMLLTFSDGETVGTCSLHCVTTEIKAKPAKKVKSLQVADFKSRALIDAKSATWVIGGQKSGVMTDVPKWAFAKKDEAEAFIKTNGGKLASFDEALALAQKEEF